MSTTTSTVSGSISNPTTGHAAATVSRIQPDGTTTTLCTVPGPNGTGSFGPVTINQGDKVELTAGDSQVPPTVNLSGVITNNAQALMRSEPYGGTPSDSASADAGGTTMTWSATLNKRGDAVQLLLV